MFSSVRTSALAVIVLGFGLCSNVHAGEVNTRGQLAPTQNALMNAELMIQRTEVPNQYVTTNSFRGYVAQIDGARFTMEDACRDWSVTTTVDKVGGQRWDDMVMDCSSVAGWEFYQDLGAYAVEYLHGSDGLRQNFIINNGPIGADKVSAELVINSTLTARLIDRSTLVYVDDEGMERMRYDGLLAWDATGKELPSKMELDCVSGETILRLVADAQNASFPVTIDPLSSSPNRLLVGTQNSAEFGYSVASAGDLNADGYSDVVVGAWKASSGQNLEGLAFVYYGSSAGIGATADVTLEVDQAGAEFGSSVSTAGDVNGDGYADLVVGARRWENNALTASEGAAFIYYGSPSGINATYDELLESNKANAFMGSNVACAGDIDNDGFSDLIIGAYLAEYPSYQEGAAFIYRGSATGMTLRHRLDGNHNGAHFSRSVASAGDVNGDGFSDIIIGASLYDNLGTNDGRAFLFYGSAGGLSTGAFLAPPSASLSGSGINSSQFGWSVTCAGDLNGDGYSDVAVGSYRDANGQSAEGAIHVFYGSVGGIITTASTILESNQANAWMGRSCAGVGDLNGDGYGDLAVGVPLFDQGQVDEGGVFIYFGSPAGVGPNRDMLLQLNNAGANMGSSLGPAGDVNGDGFSDIIVGANIYGSGGAAAVYLGGGYGSELSPSTTMDGDQSLDHLGSCVASAGDVNGDGLTDILVSAAGGTNGQVNEGLVYAYLAGASGFTATPTLLERNVANGGFGYSAATAGDVNGDGYADVIIGAPGINTGGAAYVYFGGPGGISSTPDRILTGPVAGSLFGFSVSTAGDINSDGYADVLIGAPGANTAYLFVGSTAGTVLAPTETLTGPAGGSFGLSVSSAGDVNGDGFSDLVIGAPTAGNGIVRIYHGGQMGLNTTPAFAIISSNAGAEFGTAVSGAGDVNGDGFFDIAVGAPGYSNGQVEEGALFIYYGSPTGIVGTGSTTMQRNQAGGRFGTSVSEAGDVNGDGYADVIAGGPLMESGTAQADEGQAVVYEGRSTGLTAANLRLLQLNVAGIQFGTSVAGAGDVDGDGFSDVIVGSPLSSPVLAEQGAFQVFKGNRGLGKNRLARQYQANLTAPLSTNSMDFSDPNNFGMGLYSNHYSQRMDGRLHWEIAFEGNPFNGSPITNGVVASDTSTTWTDLGIDGTEIKELIYKTPGYIRYRWRVRVEYELSKAYDGQRFSRWYYGATSGHADIGVLPVELISFDGQASERSNDLDWSVGSEQGVDRYNVYRSMDATAMSHIGTVSATGNSSTTINYSFQDMSPPIGVTYYQLEIVDTDGTIEWSPVVAISRDRNSVLSIYPNPVADRLWLSSPITGMVNVTVLDALGRVVMNSSEIPGTREISELNVAALDNGFYTIAISNGNEVLYEGTFIKE